MGASQGHKVACIVCGRKGSVKIGRNGKIADKHWNFFGTFNVNPEAGEGAYTASALEGAEANAGPRAARAAQKAGKTPVEYWECEDCFRDVQKILNKTSTAATMDRLRPWRKSGP